MTTPKDPIDDGGPASEMSLRDYFAGQAIKHMRYHGMLLDEPQIERAAVQAYVLADAMLVARRR